MLYDEKNDLYKKSNEKLLSYPPNKLYTEVKQTFSILREIIEEYSDAPNTLRNTVSPNSTNPPKASFYAIFMAFFQLIVRENKSPTDARTIIESLKGLQSDIKTKSEETKAEDRIRNIDKTVGIIQKFFVKKEPPLLGHGPSLVMDFTNSLRRSRIETPRYEFKQGILELNERRNLNEDLLDRIVNTACAMANIGPNSEGYIYFGVADKKEDADRIKKLYNIDYIEIAEHYVVGVNREMEHIGGKKETYFNKILGRIQNSKLDEPLKTQLLSQVDIFDYKNYTVIRMKVPSQSKISFVGDKAYIRQGSETIEAKANKIPGIMDIFKPS